MSIKVTHWRNTSGKRWNAITFQNNSRNFLINKNENNTCRKQILQHVFWNYESISSPHQVKIFYKDVRHIQEYDRRITLIEVEILIMNFN